MTDQEIRLVIGALLHDIGKAVYRSGDTRNHSQSGYEYLKEEAGIQDPDILDCVRYHHAARLKGASLAENSLAYLVYFADNIASAIDRREKEAPEPGFDRNVPLSSIFNILNGNHANMHYKRQVLDLDGELAYPTEEAIRMDESFYRKIMDRITDNLKGLSRSCEQTGVIQEEYINSLLEVLEANLTYIPSSTSRKELEDISLYDHLKITAAVASCMYTYLQEQGITNYQEHLVKQSEAAYKEQMFLLYSMDVSGIQKFIYTIDSDGALKSLRSRSFYLEVMMEHVVDELLEKLSLSRANLIYSGGGHCQILLPNTKGVKDRLSEAERAINRWFMEQFDIALYIAGGYAACSCRELQNEPEGSYPALRKQISAEISRKKSHRYTAEDIRNLNRKSHGAKRECKACRRPAKLDEKEKCPICSGLESMSRAILQQDFFTVVTEVYENESRLPLPGGRYLVADTADSLKKRMQSPTYVRAYAKNRSFTGKHIATKLWIGAYTTGKTFEQMAKEAQGINRIGILRADVDNLGATFLLGFRGTDGNSRYATLSRSAALSRQLSLFFKGYINQILEKGESHSLGESKKRNLTIVYSGGDDVFLAGAWDSVLEAFIDLKREFTRFTEGTLTISGGIGMYHAGYPINVMAKEVETLEEASKKLKTKNGITLFEKEEGCYEWDVFLNHVMGEKFSCIQSFFDEIPEYGKAFLYHLLELLRGSGESINRARFIYLLSRMEPNKKEKPDTWEKYWEFSRKMYEWYGNEEDRRQVITALYLYVYLHREEDNADKDNKTKE